MHFRDRVNRDPLNHVHLTDDQVDRLLTGAIEPDDAPPGYAAATAALRTARGPVESDEVTGHQAAVAFTAALTAAQLAEHMETNVIKLNPSTRRVPARAAAAAAVVVLLGAGGAAAAVLLPAGGTAKIVMASDATSSVVGTTTTEGPTTTMAATTTTSAATTTTAPTTTTVEPKGAGPDVTGPAAAGLCNAFGSRTSIPGKSVAATNLATAAGGWEHVFAFCNPNTNSSAPTTSAPGKSGEAHGRPSPAPGKSGSAPGRSSTTTTPTAP